MNAFQTLTPRADSYILQRQVLLAEAHAAGDVADKPNNEQNAELPQISRCLLDTSKYNTAVNGVLDTKHYGDEIHRSWVFRTVGYGNDAQYWRDMISNLRLVGYDDEMCIRDRCKLRRRIGG